MSPAERCLCASMMSSKSVKSLSKKVQTIFVFELPRTWYIEITFTYRKPKEDRLAHIFWNSIRKNFMNQIWIQIEIELYRIELQSSCTFKSIWRVWFSAENFQPIHIKMIESIFRPSIIGMRKNRRQFRSKWV